MQYPRVSVLIATWNRREDVLEAVESVHDQAYPYYEVIVVDNASNDGTVEALRTAFPEIKLVILDRNLGASGGRNRGVAVAEGDIVFLLDSDASLGHDTLNHIVNKFRAEPEVGVITCKILNAQTKTLDPNTWIFTEKSKIDLDSEFLSFSFCECGAAIRKEIFDRVGMFWELLFFGREGEDLSLLVLDAGYKILYSPKAIVYHRASPQKRITGCERLYLDLRNTLYIYLARYPWWMFAWFSPLKIATSVLKSARRGCMRQTLRALQEVARQMPNLLDQRTPIKKETARFYLKLQREHGSLAWDLASWLKHKI